MAEFFYRCEECGRQHTHKRGYIFVYQIQDPLDAFEQIKPIYFCDCNCCDEWRAKHEPEDEEIVEAPKPNRREAILATRQKNLQQRSQHEQDYPRS